MDNIMCSNSDNRKTLAISMCFASATLTTIETLHGDGCAWLGLNPDQSYVLSLAIATLSVFLGTLILARLIAGKQL